MTLDELRSVINNQLPFTEKQIAEEIKIIKKGVSDENIRRIALITQILSARFLFAHGQEVIDLTLQFLNSDYNFDDFSLANLYYILTTIYRSLGFPPKAIEYGEKYLLLPIKNFMQAMLIYNNLSCIYKVQGYYDKAIDYTNKAFECAKNDGRVDLTAISITTYTNNICIYIGLKNDKKIKEEYNKFVQVYENNKDNYFVKLLDYTMTLTKINYDYYFDPSKENLTKYINEIRKLKEDGNIYLIDNADVHIEIVKSMYDKKMYDECIELIAILINQGCIIETKQLCYYYLLASKEIEIKDKEEYENIKNMYINALEQLANNYHSFTNQLIDEQLKYLTYKTDYENIKKRYSIDILTSCLNRPAFEQKFPSFIEENKEGSLVFIDLDHLKCFNDKYGHRTGDEYIKAFTQLIVNSLGNDMILYRYDGDEFIVLSKKSIKETNELFDKLSSKFSSEVIIPNTCENGSFSYGVSGLKYIHNIDEIIHNADQIMYEYKKLHNNVRK